MKYDEITSSYEELTLKAYYELLCLPNTPKLLGNEFTIILAYYAGYVSRFLNGERFDDEIEALSKEDMRKIQPLISKNYQNEDGKELLTFVLLTKAACNIMNKYKRKRS